MALLSIFFCAIMLGTSAGILALKVYDEVITRHAIVTTGPAEVRNGPDMNESVGFSLPEGRSVEILSVQGDWTAIAIRAEGLKGWVATKNIQTI
jgi:SH3-like domain-containing protein